MSTQYCTIKNNELQIIKNNMKISEEIHERKEYANMVCVKPWGYEFLVYESKKIGIWFLKIVKGQKTSLHTHFHKDTLLFVISGSAKISFIDGEEQELSVLQSIYIPKYKFHGIGSFAPETYLLEIEIFDSSASFTDKNDLLRIDDQYHRKTTGYESSVNTVSENLENYNHFMLDSGFKNTIESVDFLVWELTSDNLKEIDKYTHTVILNGTLSTDGLVAKEGSLLKKGIYNNPCSVTKCTVLSLNRIDYQEDCKIIYDKEHLQLRCNKLKADGKRIVLTSGCFDILHVGHIHNIKRAKELGDVLMVCLSNDEQIKKLKGDTRPVNNYEDRINLFKTISYVDSIILYSENNIESEETLGDIMKIVDPYTWVKGSDYTPSVIFEKHPYLKNVSIVSNIENKSTTNIIRKINNTKDV